MRTSLLMTALLLAACKSTPEVKQEAPVEVKPTTPTVLVTLKREACFGRCPVYAVQVSSDGAVEFTGERAVLVEGKSTSKLDADAVAKLVARIEGSGFASWNALYATRLVTDLATVELTYKGRTIRHYLGDSKAPLELTQLEDEIDALIGTSQWVTGKGAPAQ